MDSSKHPVETVGQHSTTFWTLQHTVRRLWHPTQMVRTKSPDDLKFGLPCHSEKTHELDDINAPLRQKLASEKHVVRRNLLFWKALVQFKARSTHLETSTQAVRPAGLPAQVCPSGRSRNRSHLLLGSNPVTIGYWLLYFQKYTRQKEK
jgi:hypothetical protein